MRDPFIKEKHNDEYLYNFLKHCLLSLSLKCFSDAVPFALHVDKQLSRFCQQEDVY
jgi:hypothetical protein